MTDFVHARESMVLSQLQPSGITDGGMLDVFQATPREQFVPDSLRACCYADDTLKLAPGRFLIAPLLLARLVKALALRGTDRVLCVGGETGYGAAIVAQLAADVTDLNEDDAFADIARAALESMSLENVTRVTGDLLAGHPAPGTSPYDAILVQGALPDRPDTLCQQLRPGGLLAAVIVPPGQRVGQAVLFRHLETGGVSEQGLFDAAAPWLPGAAPLPVFRFG